MYARATFSTVRAGCAIESGGSAGSLARRGDVDSCSIAAHSVIASVGGLVAACERERAGLGGFEP